MATVDGHLFSEGDHDRPFALQSISKVFAYALALADNRREDVLARVGVEPSGDAFNSIVFDERYHRPYNPMVNAGALVTTDLVRGASGERKLERLLGVMQACAGDTSLAVNERTFARELRHADRNRATAYLMRAEGMLTGDVEELLALYLHQCSVQVTCAQLAVMGATLANGAVNPFTGERALPRDRVRDLLSVMYTCGMYDAAGQWAYEVGVPAKSGVSGGILAVIPGKGGIGVYSPGLDVYGNSVRGINVCYEIATHLGVHISPPTTRTRSWAPGRPRTSAEPRRNLMEGGPVDELLDVAVERPALDQLEVEVGRTLEDRVRPGLTGDHREERHLDAVDQAGGHQRPVHRQAAVRAQRHLGLLLEPGDDVDGVTAHERRVRPVEGSFQRGRHHRRRQVPHPGDPWVTHFGLLGARGQHPREGPIRVAPKTIRCSAPYKARRWSSNSGPCLPQ